MSPSPSGRLPAQSPPGPGKLGKEATPESPLPERVLSPGRAHASSSPTHGMETDLPSELQVAVLSARPSNMLAPLATSSTKGNLLPPRSPWLGPWPGLWGLNSQKKALGLHLVVQPCLKLTKRKTPSGAPRPLRSGSWPLGVWDGTGGGWDPPSFPAVV